MRSARGEIDDACFARLRLVVCAGLCAMLGVLAGRRRRRRERRAVERGSLRTGEPRAAPAPTSRPRNPVLSIKRGIAMLAQDRTTFRPCDEQSRAVAARSDRRRVARRRSRARVQKAPAMLYVEAYGERAPVAEDDLRSACVRRHVRARGSAVRRVQGPGARLRRAGAELHRRGARHASRSGLSKSVTTQIVWRQPEEPKEIVLGSAADAGCRRRRALSAPAATATRSSC